MAALPRRERTPTHEAMRHESTDEARTDGPASASSGVVIPQPPQDAAGAGDGQGGDGPDARGKLRKAEWEVLPVSLDVAKRLVYHHHYAKGGSNTATYLHGLFQKGAFWVRECYGVAWWIPPTKSAALATYPDDWEGVLALSRLVMRPDAPFNACSFLLARSVKLIDPKRWPCLVTYADEWQGHEGTIYKASNWEYCGMTKPEATYTKNGMMIARKAGPRTRTRQEMIDLGCELEGSFAKHKFRLVRGNPGHRHDAPKTRLRQ